MSNPNPPFVEVTWLDAWGDATAEVSLKDAAEKNKPLVMRTRGWLLDASDDGVLLANEVSGEDSYRGLNQVPHSMVTDIREIKESKARRTGRTQARRRKAVAETSTTSDPAATPQQPDTPL